MMHSCKLWVLLLGPACFLLTAAVPARPPKLQLGLTKAQIQAVMKKHHGLIRNCYVQAETTIPNLEGKIILSFVVNPKGKVVEARVKSNPMKSDEMASCLPQILRTMSFPATLPPVTTRVNTYPFYFEARRRVTRK